LEDSSSDSDTDSALEIFDESEKKPRKKKKDEKMSTKSILRFHEEPRGPRESVKKFIFSSLKRMWNSQLLFKVTVHLVGNILLFSFVKIVLQFEISTQGIDDRVNKTRDNFCAGAFSNNIEISAVTEFARVGTAIFWFTILTRVRPFHFYNRLYYVAAFILVLMVGFTFIPIGAHVGSIVLAFITSLVYLIGNYDNVIVSAVAPPEILGVAYSVQGASIYMTALIPVILTLLSPPMWAWSTILIVYLLGLISWNFFITKKHRDELCDLDDASMTTGDRWCLSRWVYGYS